MKQAPVPLSPLENMIFRACEDFDGDGTGVVRWRFLGMVDEQRLRAALARLQQRHPKLQTRIIVGRGGRRYFDLPERPNQIPIEVVDSDADPMPWQAEIFRAMAAKFDTEAGPMARATVLRNRALGVSDVFFIAHHAVNDAVSAFAIMHDLFGFYEELEKGGPLRPIVALPIVTASRATLVGTWVQQARLLARIARHRRGRRRGGWTTLPGARNVPPELCLQRRVFTERETANLFQRCREENAWPLGAHFAAACCALADILPQPEISVRCRVPINLRPWLKGQSGAITDQDVGCFIGAFESAFAASKTSTFWDLARRMRADLGNFVEAGGPQLYYNVLRLARSARVRKPVKRETMVVNYLGVARVRKKYGSLVLDEASTMAKNTTLGPSLGFGGVTVNGRLCVSACGAEMPAEFFKQFFDAAIRHLRAAAEMKVRQGPAALPG